MRKACRDIRGFHVPPIKQKHGLGLIYTPVVFFICVSEAFNPITYHTLLVQAYQRLWLVRRNDAYDHLLMLSIPRTLAPIPTWHY